MHGTAVPLPGQSGRGGHPLCATAASLFAEALRRIADLNGIPPEAKSWRHSSIANRVQLLRRYAVDPDSSARLERSVAAIKAFLLIATLIGLAIATYLYWPPQWRFWA